MLFLTFVDRIVLDIGMFRTDGRLQTSMIYECNYLFCFTNFQVRIARIFNTYGPRMCLDDGRVVSNFVAQV